MIDFTFHNPAKIIFGRDSLSHLAQEILNYGTRVLVVYGGGSIKRIGLYDEVMESLNSIAASFWELSGVQPNPRLSLVYEGIDICKKNGVELVLAVGGGSVIDTAKAIANGACYGGDVWDLYLGKASNECALPLGTVVTIPAAGSEMSFSSVITREEDSCKVGRNSPFNVPKFSILNPEYTYSLPPYQTAAGCVDIMAHLMERYFTQIQHVELTDRMMEGALVTMLHNSPIVMADPTNYDARAEIMWTGCLAHNSLFQTGRIGDWASHKLEHELSALYDIAHGAGLAIMFPAWMKYVLPRSGAKKLAQFATRVLGVPEDLGTEEDIAYEGIARLEGFYRSLDMPVRLHEAGIDDRDFDRMAQRCADLVGGTIGAFVPLSASDAVEIYKLAL
ncbi:MAG: iron-containing alcohol dehydrogenase [Clostridiales bacterium]|nr:iron-containing alcohol dehydrogenase [Clostridiales bacterium]